MPDFDSIPLHDDSDDSPDTGNRPAEGARRATPGDLGDDPWTGGAEGGDFLGLEADLVATGGAQGGPAPAPGTSVPPMPQSGPIPPQVPQYEPQHEPQHEPQYEPQHGAMPDLAVHQPAEQPHATSYASETEYSDESFSEGGYQADPNAMAPEEGYDDLGSTTGFVEERLPSSGGKAGVLISVGMALGMGAAAVVAMDYFGYGVMPESDMTRTEVATTPGPRDRSQAPTTGETLALQGTTESGAIATGAQTSVTNTDPRTRTGSTTADQMPPEDGPDPLADKLLEGGGPALTGTDPGATATGTGSAHETNGLEPDWTALEGTSSPAGTIANWFAPDGVTQAPGTGELAAATSTGSGTGEANTTGAGTLTGTGTGETTRPTPVVRFSDEPAGPEAPNAGALAAFQPQKGGAPSSIEREGTAALDGLTLPPAVAATRAADDLSKMDVVWRGEEVPFDMITSGARIWTPRVGPVRVTTKRGEVFEGKLTAVGKRRVWLGGDHGEMALDGDTVELIEHLSHDTQPNTSTDLASATGRRVKVTAPGGTFEGTVLSVAGTFVTVVTDAGGRITLDDPSIEPVREGINVKVKLN